MRNVIVALVFAVSIADAQNVSLNPKSVAAKGLAIRSDTLDGYVDDGKKRRFFGYYIHAVARTTIAGKAAYFVTMNYRSGDSFQSDTTALDAATLTPLWRRFHAREDTVSVVYNGRNVSGFAIQNRNGSITRKKISRQISDSAFSAGMLRWIAGGLPLAPGYRFSMTTYSEWSDAEATGPVTVTRSETVKIGSRLVDTWILTLSGGGERWFDKSTGAVVQEHDPRSLGGNDTWKVMRR